MRDLPRRGRSRAPRLRAGGCVDEAQQHEVKQSGTAHRHVQLQHAKRILAVLAALICVGLALYSYRSGELSLDPQQLRRMGRVTNFGNQNLYPQIWEY